MVMRAMRTGASGGIGKFILFGILGMAVAGLAISDFRGTFSGGVGSNDVAQIEDQTITLQDFHRTVLRHLAQYRQYGMTPQQAYKLGLIEDILTGEVRKEFMFKEAQKFGIEISDAQLKKNLAKIIAPQLGEGETIQQAFENILRTQGFTEAKFIEQVKKEMAADILSDAISEGYTPDTTQLANDLFQFQNQSRTVDLILFPNNEIKNIAPATDDQLRRLYESVKGVQFKIPETRTVRLALLDPAEIELEASVSEEEIKEFYESNQEVFLLDEQFIITQIMADDEQSAQKIYDLVQKGTALKEAGQQIIGESVKYIEKVPFEAYAMLPVMRDNLKDREPGVIKPPVKSMLGYHIMMLDHILPPSVKTLDQVRAQIKQEITAEKRAEEAYKIIIDLEERIENGESFEKIKETLPLKITTLENIDKFTVNQGKNDAIKLEDAQDITEMIFSIEDGQTFSVLEELPSGHFAIAELIRKTPENVKPYEEVKDALEKQFTADQKTAENTLKVQKLLAEIQTGGRTFDTLAKENSKNVQKVENITMKGPIAEPLSDQNRPVIFKAALNTPDILDLQNGYAIMRVSDFKIPDLSEAGEGQIEVIQETLIREAQDEALLMYVRYLGKKYSAQVNQPLLERAYGGTDEN